MWREKYRDKNIIVVLGLLIAGISLLIVSEILSEGIFKSIMNQISLAILISGVLGIIDQYFLKDNLVSLILDKLKIKSDVDSTGIEEIIADINRISYDEYFKKAKNNIDIVHIYGRTWTNNYIDEIMDRVKNSRCNVRIVLVDPDSLFVPALEKHFKYEDGQLKTLIEEATSLWKNKYTRIKQEATSRKKRSRLGRVELYYHSGQPTNSMYKIDERMIVVQTKTTVEKTTRLPAMIFKNTNKTDCFFKIYDKEINQLIKESRLIDLSN